MKRRSFILGVSALPIACTREQLAASDPEEPEGSFATRPALTRIAFGSCAFQWEPQPIHRAVVDARPGLYLLLGDAIYGDFDGKKVYDVTEESLRAD